MMRVEVVSILCHLLIGIGLASAQPQNCDDTAGNFTINDTYGKNRDLILASLPSNVSVNGGFFNTTIGQEPEKVYALGLCRGDYTQGHCYSCISSSIRDLKGKCPNQKQAIYIYKEGECLVRYADHSFFGILDQVYDDAQYDGDNLKLNSTKFDAVWKSLMGGVVRNASMGTSRLKYATGEADFSAYQKIYALMQCTPDLSQKDCNTCLNNSVGEYERCCLPWTERGYIMRSSCLFRWDLNRFYVSINATASLSPPSTSGSGTTTPSPITKGK